MKIKKISNPFIINKNYYQNSILNVDCGEQILPIGKDGSGSSCNLASINLKLLYTSDIEKYPDNINWDMLDNIIKNGIDYLDESIETEQYFDKGIEKNQKYYRDLGLGLMGYADLLILKKIKYGSEESLKFIEKLMTFILDKSYKYSALRAKKLGKAPVYNDYELNPYYLNKCSKETIDLVNKYGLRNGKILNIAPTGCSIFETKIKTTDGIKSIKEILIENDINYIDLEKIGKKQWIDLKNSFNVININGEIQTVNRLFYNGYGAVNNIKFNDNTSFVGTNEHKFLVKSTEKEGYGYWKSVKDLTKSDEIIVDLT